MNNKIKQLALQAGLKREDLHYTEEQPPYIIVSYRGLPNNGDPLVKFAELIVRECLSMCVADSGEGSLGYKTGIIFATNRCQQNIKQHFGVKE